MGRKADTRAEEPTVRDRNSESPKTSGARVRTQRNTLPWMSESTSGTRRREEVLIVEASGKAARKNTLPGMKVQKTLHSPVDAVIVEAAASTASKASSAEKSKKRFDEKSGVRRRDTGRAYVAVENVGARAVAIASNTKLRAPRVVATREDIRRAPLDQVSAFVLAFVDGTVDAGGLADVTGLPDRTVREALRRLVEIGLVELPQ